ncbi:MAG: signal peptidase II [Clostridia bacterium]|nr:signal peptidase II [Clostridia bacterium]
MKKYLGWIFVIVGIIIDQITKSLALNIEESIEVIPGFLNFTLVKNEGAAFGIAQGSNYILLAISIVICLVFIGTIIVLHKKEERVSPSFYLLVSGAIGNILDRMSRGFVVDFIDTPFIATFNIADSLVVIGVIWLLAEETIVSVFSKKNKENK